MTWLITGVLLVAGALFEVTTARMTERAIRWWAVVPLMLIGLALMLLWWTHILALIAGVLLVAGGLIEVATARTTQRAIRWWVVVPLILMGLALAWLWWTYLRFPLVHPVT